VSESDELNEKVRCDYCGNQLRRLAREGFLQKKVYSKFGYYPWECPLCREPIMVKQQHRLKKRSEGKSETV
jgi:DNA-directed RNA polymerase subunit RPC12/RpoP